MELFDTAWPTSALLVILLITLMGIAVWRARTTPVRRQIFASAAVSLLLIAILFALRGSVSMPSAVDSLTQKTIASIVIFLTLNAIVQFVKYVIVDTLEARRQISVPLFILDLLGWLIVIIVSLSIVSNIFNLELTGILVTSTVVSAVIGLALQDTLGNLISGVALQVENPFRNNEWVEIDGYEGQIVRQNWRTLALRTRDNHLVLVTNANVAKSAILNFSRPSSAQAVNAFVSAGYKNPPAVVKGVLLAAVSGAEGVLDAPAPRIELLAFRDSAIEYRVRYWIDDYALRPLIHDSVMTRIWYGLRRAHIDIPFPIRDVHLHTTSAAERDDERQRRQQLIVTQLRRAPLFAKLNDDQLGDVAGGARLLQFTVGEKLVTQDQSNRTLYIIESGTVAIMLRGPSGRELRVDEEGSGSLIGIMSLLTGESCSFSAVALKECSTLAIDKDAFARAMQHDPNITETLIDATRRRQRALQSRIEALRGQQEQLSGGEGDLMQRISNFLGLFGG